MNTLLLKTIKEKMKDYQQSYSNDPAYLENLNKGFF